MFSFVNTFAQKHYYDAYDSQTWTPQKNWSSKSRVQKRISFEFLSNSTIITIGENSSNPLRLEVYSQFTRNHGFEEVVYNTFNKSDIRDHWTVRFVERTPNGLMQVYLDHGPNYTIKYNVKPFYQFDY